MVRRFPEPKIAIGPSNAAGQAYAWAHALRRQLKIPADSFCRNKLLPKELVFHADRTIPAQQIFNPLCRHSRLKKFFSSYSHVLLDGFSTIFQLRGRRNISADAKFLTEQGFQVGLIAHGSELRDPNRHLRDNKFSHFLGRDNADIRAEYRYTTPNLKLANSGLYPVFVSTPDLLLDVPTAKWLPLAIDVERWSNTTPIMQRKIPRVLHIPSRRIPPIKGTQYIDPVLNKLQEKGLIEYVSPNTVAHSQMPQLMKSCDIVVDQLLIGAYGVTSVESMASGRATVAFIDDATRELLPTQIPIANASPATFEEIMIELITDRQKTSAIGQAGPDYVKTWHDGTAAANAIRDQLSIDV